MLIKSEIKGFAREYPFSGWVEVIIVIINMVVCPYGANQ